jgi:hypothetical protein
MANKTAGRWAVWMRRFVALAVCAASVPVIANSHREIGPLSPVALLMYTVVANFVMAVGLFLAFRDTTRRNRFLVIYNVCVYNLYLAFLLLPSRPIDCFIRDMDRIRPGMSLTEAKQILRPWLEGGALREQYKTHVARFGTDIICYTPRRDIDSFQEAYLTVKQGRVESAFIHWD